MLQFAETNRNRRNFIYVTLVADTMAHKKQQHLKFYVILKLYFDGNISEIAQNNQRLFLYNVNEQEPCCKSPKRLLSLNHTYHILHY